MNNRFYEIGNKTENIVQDGPKEHLLCGKCEQKLARYEKYYKEAFHLGRHKIEIAQQGSQVIIENLDYTKTKLLLLSILWRMSICSLPQFADVSLGDNEEIIRKSILEEAAGRREDYPIAAIVPLMGGKMNESWSCFPFVANYPQGASYGMVIGGICYLISISRHDPEFDKWLLYETGRWAMPMIDFYKIPFLKGVVDNNFRNGI